MLIEDKNGEFRLEKYFVLHLQIKNDQDFTDGDLEDFIICTNISSDLDQNTVQDIIKENESENFRTK